MISTPKAEIMKRENGQRTPPWQAYTISNSEGYLVLRLAPAQWLSLLKCLTYRHVDLISGELGKIRCLQVSQSKQTVLVGGGQDTEMTSPYHYPQGEAWLTSRLPL